MKRFERPRVVPVIEMTVPLLHTPKRCENVLNNPERGLRSCNIEVDSRYTAQQAKPDIRWGGSVCNTDRRTRLPVVGGEIIVLGRAEILKKGPNSLGEKQKIAFVFDG